MRKQYRWIWLLYVAILTLAAAGFLWQSEAGEIEHFRDAYLQPDVASCHDALNEMDLPDPLRTESHVGCDVFYGVDSVSVVEEGMLWGGDWMEWYIAQKHHWYGSPNPDAWVPGFGESLRDCWRYLNVNDCQECIKYHCGGRVLPDGTIVNRCSPSRERTYLDMCFPIREQ